MEKLSRLLGAKLRMLFATSFLMLLFAITPIYTYANWIIATDSSGTEKRVFSANQAVYVEGQLDKWDGIGGFQADIYVTKDVAWQGGEELTGDRADVTRGGHNTIWSVLMGGPFLAELVWAPDPHATEEELKQNKGEYDLVIDEDQDGKYDAGVDYVLGRSAGHYAFRMVGPTGPVVDLSDVKEEAWRQREIAVKVIANNTKFIKAFNTAMTLYEYGTSVGRLDAVVVVAAGEAFGVGTSMADYAISDYISIMGMDEDGDGYPDGGLSKQLADHYGSLAADPPDPDFTELAQLGAVDVYSPHTNSSAEIALVAWVNRIAEQTAIVAALTKSIERYYAAWMAYDDYYTIMQAESIKKYVGLLVENLNNTAQTLSNLMAEGQKLGLDAVINADDVRAFQQRIATTGFTAEEVQQFVSDVGMTEDEIIMFHRWIVAVDLEDMEDGTLTELLESVRAGTTAAVPIFQTLSDEVQKTIDHYAPYVDILHPTAILGGHYAGDEGANILLDGSASTDPNGEALNHAWDLDADGEFDDASGVQVEWSWNSEFSGYVGLKVTNVSGLSDVAWAQVNVQSVNDSPSISVNAPATSAPVVMIGDSLTFDVSISDPDGDTLTSNWDVDGTTTSTGSTWTYTPGPGEAGVRRVAVTVSDGNPLSRDAMERWRVIVKSPPAPPVAHAGPDQTVRADADVVFDGTASHDPDGGTIVAYEWDIDDRDGVFDSADMVGATPTLAGGYPDAGADYSVTVTLRVTDNLGLTSEDTMTVHVLVHPLVKVTSNDGGTVTPSGDVKVPYGANQVFTVEPDVGYHVVDAKLGGESIGAVIWIAVENATYDNTIDVTFAINTYTIAASAGAGGSIDPEGQVQVTYGADQTFNITPDPGYSVKDVLVDGVSVGPGLEGVFNDVKANHTIEAVFEIAPYTIVATAGAGGAISPAGNVWVAHGANQTFTMVPDAGYHVTDVLVDGVSKGDVLTHTFSNVTGDHTIQVVFAIDTHIVKATAYTGGSITPSGNVTVDHGADQTFTITPNANYSVRDARVDGKSVGAILSITFTDITKDHTVEAYFDTDIFTITTEAGPGGRITPGDPQTVSYGNDKKFTMRPDSHYHVVDVLVDGVSVGAVASYTFKDVTANHTISATFAIDTYTIEATAGPGGSITPSGDVVLDYGADQEFTITPDPNYYIDRVLVNGKSKGADPTYTFTNVTKDQTIEAIFARDTYIIAAAAAVGGTITPDGDVTVSRGGNQRFTIAANAGYHIAYLLVDGGSVGVRERYIFADVRANHTIEAFFAPGAPEPLHLTVTKSADPSLVALKGSRPVSGEKSIITLTVAGEGTPGTVRFDVDIVFALDSSGSMEDNDPSGLRKTAAKDFVDNLDPTQDTAGVVSWDSGINFAQDLTSDFALAKSQIDLVDASGGTNLNAGLNAAIDLLDAGGRPDASHVILFLSNGSGSYSHSTAASAADKGYVIYSIGLGSAPAEEDLIDMADTTGGKYYSAPTADSLEAIFDDIVVATTNIAGRSIVVSETLQNHINLEGSYTTEPDDVVANGTTILSWNIDELSTGETWTVSFEVSSSQLGALPAQDGSSVQYVNYLKNPASEPIPQQSITTVTNEAPVAQADGPYSGVVGQAVTFDGLGSSDPEGDILTYSWDFGDGSTGAGSQPTHPYAAGGTYTVTLIVRDQLGNSEPSVTTAEINTPPVANADGPYEGNVGKEVTFDGSGSSDADGDGLKYTWDFGDGNTGTGMKPKHAYAAGGTYPIQLIVNDGKMNSTTATATAVINTPPVADANGPYREQAGVAIAFDGSGSSDADNDPLTYAWDFGDGNTDTGVKPTHTYSTNGTYTVTLIVEDGNGNSAAATAQAIINTPPVADANGARAAQTGEQVTFDGSGSSDADGDALTYRWNFGDGSLGTGVSPTHTYTTGGQYTVSLVVNDGKVDSAPDTTQADINTPPIANPDGPYSGSVGEQLTFDGSRSSDADTDPLSYTWDFGDDSTGTGIKPTHDYAASGIYTVTLIVNDGEVDSALATTTAAINTPPVADANGPYAAKPGEIVRFDGSGSSDADGDPLTYRWDFGDGNVGASAEPIYAYAAAGTYNVTLNVNDGKVDSSPATATVVINTPPVADANGPYTGNLGIAMEFDGSESSDADGDSLTYKWDFGDGSTGTGVKTSHNYSVAGTHTVTLTVNDGKVDSEPVTTEAAINTPPLADAGGPYTGSTSLAVEFDGSGSSDADGDPLTYKWDFGDGSVGTGVKPEHEYNAIGTYAATLIVNDGKIDSTPSEATVEIVNTPPVAVAQMLTEEDALIARFAPVRFDGSASYDVDGDELTYSWDFGDRDADTDPNPEHTYFAPGTYTATLIVNDGKVDSAPSKVELEAKQVLMLMAASYDILKTTLSLTFSDAIDPGSAWFDKMGMEVDDSGKRDFALSDARRLYAETAIGDPNTAIMDINRDHVNTINLAVAGIVTHQKVDMLLDAGAFTGKSGVKSRQVVGADDIQIQMIAHGFVLGTVGDVSGNGEVTAYDAALILRASVVEPADVFPVYHVASEATRLLEAYGYQYDVMMGMADINSNGDLSAYDAALVLRRTAGFAAPTPSFNSGVRQCKLSVSNCDDQRMDISIGLSDVSDIYSAEIAMTYAPQALTVADVSTTSSTADWLFEQETTVIPAYAGMDAASKTASLRVSLAGARQPAADGALITISFAMDRHSNLSLGDTIKQLNITELKLNDGMVKASVENLPKAFALMQNYPNPFNPETWIPYQLSEPANVIVTIYNLAGQMVRKITLGTKMPGQYTDKPSAAYWDGRNEAGEKVASGIYFYQLQAGRDASVRKMIVIR